MNGKLLIERLCRSFTNDVNAVMREYRRRVYKGRAEDILVRDLRVLVEAACSVSPVDWGGMRDETEVVDGLIMKHGGDIQLLMKMYRKEDDVRFLKARLLRNLIRRRITWINKYAKGEIKIAPPVKIKSIALSRDVIKWLVTVHGDDKRLIFARYQEMVAEGKVEKREKRLLKKAIRNRVYKVMGSGVDRGQTTKSNKVTQSTSEDEGGLGP